MFFFALLLRLLKYFWYKAVFSLLEVHGDLLKGSTRPVKMVHDLLLAVLGSTEVQKYRGTVTRYFFSTVINKNDTFKKCTIFDTVTVDTFLTVLLHYLVLFLNKF